MICFLRSEEPTVVYQQGPSTWSLYWSRCLGRWESLRQPCCCCSAAKWCWILTTPWTAARQAFLLSLSPEFCSNPCTLNWWCHPTISSSVAGFSSCLQSFPASGSFPMSQCFAGQSIGASASASCLPVNIQGWFPLGLSGLISLLSMGLSRVSSSATVQKVLILWHLAFFLVQLSHLCITTGKTIALTILTFVGKIMSLLFNMLSSI